MSRSRVENGILISLVAVGLGIGACQPEPLPTPTPKPTLAPTATVFPSPTATEIPFVPTATATPAPVELSESEIFKAQLESFLNGEKTNYSPELNGITFGVEVFGEAKRGRALSKMGLNTRAFPSVAVKSGFFNSLGYMQAVSWDMEVTATSEEENRVEVWAVRYGPPRPDQPAAWMFNAISIDTNGKETVYIQEQN